MPLRIKSLWVAGSLASALLMTSNAFAAADAWQGFYAGAALGGREQEAQWKQDGRFAFPTDGEVFDIGVTSKNTSKDSAAYIALYGGYNWALGERLLAGVELAGGYANNQSEKNRLDLGIPIDIGTYVSVKTDWDASLRGRLGFLLTPSVLLYGTGGVAVTRLNTTGYCGVSEFAFICGAPTKTDDSKTLVGWTAGFGAETSLTANLLARVEYQYSDYGSESFWAPDWKQGQSFGIHNKVDLTTQTLTLGLAYHF